MARKPGHIKVLLVNTNRIRPAVGPLGIELVVDALAVKGFTPVICDLAWERSPLKALAKAIKRHRPRVVGVSVRNIDDCYYASRAFLLPPVRRLIRAIKEATDAPVVIGGVGFSIAPRAALEYLEADCGIRGDGEESFPRLVEMIAAGQEPSGLPGLVVPGRSAPAPAEAALKDMPAPARDSLDLPRYFRLGGQGNLETQRGCNRKCIYCADPVAKGQKIRRRHPESVAEEMGRLISRGVHAFHLCDPEFNLSRRHAEAVCRALIRARLSRRIKWYAYALPNPMDGDLAGLMAEAGCVGIDFSVDSADSGMLSTLGRDFSAPALEKCAKTCRKAGIIFMYDLLMAGPGEDKKTMARTIKRMKRIRPDQVGVSFGVRIFPGTALGEAVEKRGPLVENPCLHGSLKNNPRLLKPVFYVSEKLGPEPETYLKKLIDDDPIFLFASKRDLDRNYNYNNNPPLCEAIRKGERGAYWDILRRRSGR
jgi:radical SAM superfamily enzyme YgiQ (UPF0313 family)